MPLKPAFRGGTCTPRNVFIKRTTTLQASKIDVKQKLTNPGICLHWKCLMQKCFFQRSFFFYRHYVNVTWHKGSQTLYFVGQSVALKWASDCMKTLNQNVVGLKNIDFWEILIRMAFINQFIFSLSKITIPKTNDFYKLVLFINSSQTNYW